MGIRVRRYFQNLGLVLAAVWLFSGTVNAQERCFWENPCTPTPSPSPTLVPGQPTPTPTQTPDPSATATATSSISPEDFSAPEFGLPTSIPNSNLNAQFPAPSPIARTPIPIPSAVVISLETPMPYTPMPITSSIVITLEATMEPITYTVGEGISPVFSDTVGGLNGFTSDLISYTHAITSQAEAIRGTEVITIQNAPSWYAPALPRPLADVGWTFEQLTGPEAGAPNYSFSSWAAFGGHVVTLPFSLVRSVWLSFKNFGPFGLFLAWLFVMAVLVAVVKLLMFLLRLAIVVIRIGVRLLELLGEWVPTGG